MFDERRGGTVAATREPHTTPDTRLVRPRLSDDQLATLQRYGTVEPTTIGQVLFAAGDPSYDLIVLLGGRVEVSVAPGTKPWPIAVAGPRDFLAELNLLTGQRVYFTGVVTEAGSIVRVPRDRVGEVIDKHGDLGAFLLQEMFRRRQMFLQSRAGVQIVGSRYSPDTQRLREFAMRNRLADGRHDPDKDPPAARPARLGRCSPRRPPGRAHRGSRRPAHPAEHAVRTGRRHHRRAGPGPDLRPDRDRCGARRAGRRGVRGIGGAEHGSGRC